MEYSKLKRLKKIFSEYQQALEEKDADWREEIVNSFRKEFPEMSDKKISDLPKLIYSNNQLLFIKDMEENGYEIDYNYSGRGMFGETCPSVVTDDNNLPTKAKLQVDSMGLSRVFYAQY